MATPLDEEIRKNINVKNMDTGTTLEVCTKVDNKPPGTKSWIVKSPLEYTWENFSNDFKENVMDIGDYHSITVCLEMVPKNNDDLFYPVISSQRNIHLNVKLDSKKRNVEGHNGGGKKRKVQRENVLHPVGLVNKENNCFANAVLQCLSGTTGFLSYLTEYNYRECNGFCFTCIMRRHIGNIQKHAIQGTTFRASEILDKIKIFGGDFKKGLGDHHDAYEFLMKLMEAMASKKDKHGSLDSVFGGKFITQVSCPGCRHVSTTPHGFSALHLEVHSDHKGNAQSLADCLSLFTENSVINEYKCESCKKDVEATRCQSILVLPDVLILVLMRFKGGVRFGDHISFPLHLHLSPYVVPRNTQEKLYELYATLLHEGSLELGHYKSYVKYENWFLAEDETVTRVSDQHVLNKAAYILFYRRHREDEIRSPVGLVNNVNKDNCCFANATLQCLSCTTGLLSYLTNGQHEYNYQECNGFCFTCIMRRHIGNIQKHAVQGTTFRATEIVDNIKTFGGDFEKGLGDHHDAYEFLVKLIEAMASKEDKHGSLDSLFGGNFLSQVSCSECGNVSATSHYFRALNLEVHSDHKGNAQSLADCLNFFSENAVINEYKCERSSLQKM